MNKIKDIKQEFDNKYASKIDEVFVQLGKKPLGYEIWTFFKPFLSQKEVKNSKFNDLFLYEDKELDKKIRKIKEVKVEEWEKQMRKMSFYPKLVEAVIVSQVEFFIDSLLKAHTSRIVGIVEGMKKDSSEYGLDSEMQIDLDVQNKLLDDILKAIRKEGK
jgi:hypothetical protein